MNPDMPRFQPPGPELPQPWVEYQCLECGREWAEPEAGWDVKCECGATPIEMKWTEDDDGYGK